MNNYEQDIKAYNDALKTIREIKDKYNMQSTDYDRVDRIALKINFVEKCGINSSGLLIASIGRFDLRIVPGSYSLSNIVNHAKLITNEAYILLENGNIGKLAFINDNYWNEIEDEYNDFRNEMDKLAIEYDSFNSYWLFEPSAETVEKIKEIIKTTQDKIDVKLRAERIKQLEEELASLR